MAEETDEGSRAAEEQRNVSRRGFLKTAAVGAAATGVAAATPGILQGDSPLSRLLNPPPGAAGEPIVAYVGDAKTGDIVLMRGEQEVRIRDFGIVSWLVRASSGL